MSLSQVSSTAVAAVKPAEATSGNAANAGKLRLASGALETVGDVFSRFLITYGGGVTSSGGVASGAPAGPGASGS